MKKWIGVLFLFVLLPSLVYGAYADVQPDDPYAEAIEFLTEKKIIQGYEDHTFHPWASITRAEMIKMLVTATNATINGESTFIDVAENHWAKEFIRIGVGCGYIQGDGDGKFRPEDSVTYGEVATMLVRAMGKEEEALALNKVWPENYWQITVEQGLYDENATVNLTEVAKRNQVAFMLYRMLKAQEKPVEPEQNQEETPSSYVVDTKTAYTGIVTAVYQLNGQNHIVIQDYQNQKVDVEVYRTSPVPEENDFVIYQFRQAGIVKVRKILKTEDLAEGFALVTDIDEEFVTLQGHEDILDLELKNYEWNGQKIALEKYQYCLLEWDEEENEFTQYELSDREKLVIKKKDCIRFETDLNICFIVRHAD